MTLLLIANEPAERGRSAGEAVENSAARRMLDAKKFLTRGRKCKFKLHCPVLANCKDGTIRAVVVLANQEAPYIYTCSGSSYLVCV